MPITKTENVKDLRLDLFNFRTVPQKNEVEAVQAMISISPDRFWALMESLISDGYLPTENIIVLNDDGSLIVREGNRRIAALKIIYGYIPNSSIPLPESITTSIASITEDWKEANKAVPCTIYSKAEASTVDRVVTLAHGKGEKASRDQWNAVARARHNRDVLKIAEPAIDLLEKYLTKGKNLTANQKTRWSGDYPLSVLDEAMKRLALRLEVTNAVSLAKLYPAVNQRDSLENILRDIGLQVARFEHVRNKSQDFGVSYGIPMLPTSTGTSSTGTSSTGTSSTGTSSTGTNSTGTNSAGTSSTGTGGTGTSSTGTSSTGTSGTGAGGTATGGSTGSKTPAFAISDPKTVAQALKTFVPLGSNREKVVTLLVEIRRLKLANNPIAFCFLLRSMFEISAKAYCNDHKADGLASKKPDGQDRFLIDVLRDVTNHMTNNGADKATIKALHGALAEFGKKDGFLSVTSMNQLVHNPTFSVTANDISTLFGNVFPLLHAMNQ